METEDPNLSSKTFMPVNVSAIRLRLMIGGILVLLLAQCFNAGLSVSHFAKLHTDSLISLSRVNAQSLQRKLRNDISLGKPLEQFFGIDAYMQEVKDRDEQITNVRIEDTNGKILYSLDKQGINEGVPEPLVLKPKDVADSEDDATVSVLFKERYHILLPVKDREQVWLGTIDISFPAAPIDNRIKPIIKLNLQVLAATTLVAALLLFLGLGLFVRIQGFEPPPRKRIFLVVLLVVGFAQILYSSFNIQHFKSNYVDTMQSNIGESAEALKKELERWFAEGIEIDRLPGMACWMQEVVRATPEVENMRITITADGKPLYEASAHAASDIVLKQGEANCEAGVLSVQSNTNLDILMPVMQSVFEVLEPVSLPLNNGKTDIIGYLHVEPSSSTLGSRLGEIVADSLTVLIISLIFSVEMIIFLLILIERQIYEPRAANTQTTSDYGLIRPVAFVYLFAVDLSVSFLPLHMRDLYKPIFDLSEKLVMGLPLSVSMLFAGIMMIVAGGWMDRRGWHEPFIVGVLLTAVGAGLAGLSQTAVEFIGARAIMGIGYGAVIISTQGFIFSKVHDRLRGRGITNLVAGLFAGSICGTVSGGMLAERLGFSGVFFVSSVMVIIAVLFAVIFMTHTFVKPDATKKDSVKLGMAEWLSFIFDRNIFSLMLFSSVPSALVMVGVLYYATPIFLSEEKIGQANIGRIVMLYGLCMIYLGPFVGRLVERIENKRPIIFLSGVCGALGMCAFYLLDGVSAIIVTIGMLGIAGSLGAASQSIYAMNLQATQRFGQGQAMGVYRSVERMGQVLGPLVVGSMLLVLDDLNTVLVVLGGFLFVVSFLFLFISKPELKADSQSGAATGSVSQ